MKVDGGDVEEAKKSNDMWKTQAESRRFGKKNEKKRVVKQEIEVKRELLIQPLK